MYCWPCQLKETSCDTLLTVMEEEKAFVSSIVVYQVPGDVLLRSATKPYLVYHLIIMLG